MRPYSGRSVEFAEAMERAEHAARPKPYEHPFVGRTRAGSLRHRDGHLVQPGPLFDAATFNELPLID